MMTAAEIRLNQNPILSNLLLGFGQGDMVAERLFPRLPTALRGLSLAKMGDAARRAYNLKRAPGTATKRVDIKYQGQTYTVNQYSVEVPIPREHLQEADTSRRLNVGNYLDISRIAMSTVNAILALDYEIEVAGIATTVGNYGANVAALAGATKWSAATGTPVTDIRAAAETIRAAVGKRPNTLTLSAVAFKAVTVNAEVKTYLPSSQLGPATVDQLKVIFNVRDIVIGDATRVDDAGTASDVWGNNAILAYVPNIGGANGGDINLAEPAFGFTTVLEGHPYAEAPYFENQSKSWIYGGTFERQPSIAYAGAGFLFTNPN